MSMERRRDIRGMMSFMDYDKTKNFGIFMKDKQDEYKETLESSYQQTLDVKRVDTNDIEKGYKMTKKYIESGADIIMNAGISG